MGSAAEAECLDCGDTFWLRDGGGFFFHLLRCERCGETTVIGFDDLGELHRRYLKGLPNGYSVVSAEYDRHVRDNLPVQPIDEAEYLEAVEDFAGYCECGGRFIFGAPPRCPQCMSTRVEAGPPTLMYD